MVEVIRLGRRVRNQLISLKRKTGIEHWNILCRWAFTLSLSEKSRPRAVNHPLDGGIEMTWRTFGGEYVDIYEALLIKRCIDDELALTPAELSQQLRFHLYRGIGYLAVNRRINNVADLAILSVDRRIASSATTASSSDR